MSSPGVKVAPPTPHQHPLCHTRSPACDPGKKPGTAGKGVGKGGKHFWVHVGGWEKNLGTNEAGSTSTNRFRWILERPSPRGGRPGLYELDQVAVAARHPYHPHIGVND